MSTDKKKAARRALVAGKAIPLGELFRRNAGSERNARLALADPKTPPELRAELERYLADPVGAVLDDGAKERREARGMIASAASTALAPYRGGRKKGAVNKKAEEFFRGLVARHRDATGGELWLIYGGKPPISTMQRGTFLNRVSRARSSAKA